MKRIAFALLALGLAASAAAADLRFATVFSPAIQHVYDPGLPVTYSIGVASGDPVQSVVFTMPLPAGARFIGTHAGATDFTCEGTSDTVTCRAGQVGTFLVSVLFDVATPPAGGHFVTRATLSSSTPDTDLTNNSIDITLDVYRPFVVTTAADSGNGSLRQAILDLNASCGSAGMPNCKVTFDLGQATATIEPRSPLPVITACGTVIDGGEVVALSGTHLTSGDGLTIRTSCPSQRAGVIIEGVTIQSLAIHSFPGSGILIAKDETDPAITSSTHHAIVRDFIGTDATGTIPLPNLRGVVVSTDAGIDILRSNISNNIRSGVFLWSTRAGTLGSASMITGNRLDDNGASGIFTNTGGIYFDGNEVARNHEIGVAIARGARLAYLTRSNVIQGNGIGVDRGLDGPTLTGDPGIPNAPVITSATYDAASNTTSINVRYDASPGQAFFGANVHLAVYANSTRDGSGRAEAERFVADGEVALGGSQILKVTGDLRGQILTAMASIFFFDDALIGESSELSDGVVVQ